MKRTLEGHANMVLSCALTSDGRRAVSTSSDETVKAWDLDTGRVLATLDVDTDELTSCAMTPDDRRVVFVSDDPLTIWDLDTHRTLRLENELGWLTSCVVTPDGRRVVATSHAGSLALCDLETGRVLATLEGHTRWAGSCAVTPDGRRVVSASGDQTLRCGISRRGSSWRRSKVTPRR
jgi:WD40 repeat protein